MARATALILVAALIGTAHALEASRTPVWHGLAELAPRLDRRVVADTSVPSHRTSLSMSVEHEPANYVSLGDDTRVASTLRCDDDATSSVTAPTWSAAAAAALAAELQAGDAVVVGFCSSGDSERATVPVSGAVLGATVAGDAVVVSLRPLLITDIVRNGNATFRAELHQPTSSAFVAAEATAACPASCISCINGGGGSGCESACSACSDTCTTCVKFEGGLACAERCSSGQVASCTFGDLIEGHCTANADYSHSWAGWDLVQDDGKVLYKHGLFDADAEIVCEKCHAHLTPSLVVNIAVSDNSLASLDVTVTGAYSAIANVSAVVTDSFNKDGSTSLSVPSIPSVNFFLGAFPVHISFDVDVTATYSLSASGKAQVYSGLTVDGSVKAGATYSKGNGVHPTWDSSFQPGFIRPGGAVSGSASVTAALLPSLKVKIDEVGSATLDLKPSVTLAAQLADTCVRGTLSGSFDAQLSATIGLQLAGKTLGPAKSFGPKDMLQKQWPSLWTGEFGC